MLYLRSKKMQYQHNCGGILDEEDVNLGICPVCCKFLPGSLGILNELDDEVNIVVPIIHRPPGEPIQSKQGAQMLIDLEQNPQTGTFETVDHL
jgi:hypothetical protein